MISLSNLSPQKGSKKDRKRVGRGSGSGLGKTSGRGHKGAKSRSGYKSKPGFEGVQMPLQRRLPKRGFHNPFTVRYQVVNLRDLERVGDATEVNAEVLARHGLVKNPKAPVTLLGDGAVTKAYTIEVHRASKSAVEAVQAAGGSVNLKSLKS